MDIQTAQAAAPLAAKIGVLTKLIADIDLALEEGWRVSDMAVSAPSEGSTKPAGTKLNLLPTGEANAEISAFALQTAKQTYQDQLSALTLELTAL